MTFADRARDVQPRRIECETCNFLARLDPEYRAEVVEAMSDRSLSTGIIMKLLDADGHDVPTGDGAFNRHRRGQCVETFRRRMLGDADGVIR